MVRAAVAAPHCRHIGLLEGCTVPSGATANQVYMRSDMRKRIDIPGTVSKTPGVTFRGSMPRVFDCLKRSKF